MIKIKNSVAILIICIFIFGLFVFARKISKPKINSKDKVVENTNNELRENSKEENKKKSFNNNLNFLIEESINEYKSFVQSFNKVKENGLTKEEGMILSVQLAKFQLVINDLQVENNLTTTHPGILEEVNSYCANMTAFITLVYTVCVDDVGQRTHNQVLKNSEFYVKNATENLEKISKYLKNK